MSKSFIRILAAQLCAVLLASQASHAEVCTAISPHLANIEQQKRGRVDNFTIGMGETSCKYGPTTSNIFKNNFECVWTNTSERTWTRQDARDLGQKLKQSCSVLTSHFGSGGHGEEAFLWYGNFTTVLIFVTETGLRLSAQIDEEAYHWS